MDTELIGRAQRGDEEAFASLAVAAATGSQGPSDLWHIWVLDVDGVRVVIRSDTYPGTSAKVQAEPQAIVDSIQIEP